MTTTKKISTDRQLKTLRPADKKYRRAIVSKHGGGLSGMVLPSGRIQFLLRYRKPINKKQTEVILPAAQLSPLESSICNAPNGSNRAMIQTSS